jgi:hypothetical protein
MPTEKDHTSDRSDRDERTVPLQVIEQRILAFAAHQESQLDELRQLIEQVQIEQRQAEAEIALYGEQASTRANEALARVEEALRRLEAIAPEAVTADLPTHLSDGADTLASSVRDVEPRVTVAVAAQQESRLEELRQLIDQLLLDQQQTETTVREVEQRLTAVAGQAEPQLEELRQLIEQVRLERRQAEADVRIRAEQAAARADEALARADETLQRLDTLATTAPPAPEASPAELSAHLSGHWDLASSVTDQESRLEELRQLIGQVQLQQGQAEAEGRARAEQAAAHANEALVRADEAMQRIEAAAVASQSPEAQTTALLDRLSAGADALTGSLREVEQRLAAVAAQQESRLDELRQLIDQLQLDQQQAETAARASAEHAAARADEALQRLETAAAASQTREASTTAMLDRLTAGTDGLASSVREVEQRVTAVAARQESSLEELRQLIDHVQLEHRQAQAELRAHGEQATTRADEAVARSDETARRLEAAAAASQVRAASTADLLERLSGGAAVLASSVQDVEHRLAAVAAQQQAATASSQHATEAGPSVALPEGSRSEAPGNFAPAVGIASEPIQAVASWLVLTAPGILLPLLLLALAVVATPWITSFVLVAPGVRATAAALLLAHGGVIILVLRRGRQWPAAAAFLTVLALDGFCAGMLLGADLQLGSPAVSICLALLAMSLMAGGWRVGLGSVLAVCAGIETAMYRGLEPLVLSPVMSVPTTLSVETSFANAPAVMPPSFLTTLSVETLYGGSPVAAFSSSAPLFMPVLAIMLLAICLSAGLNLLRARKAGAAVAATIVAAHRCVVRG